MASQIAAFREALFAFLNAHAQIGGAGVGVHSQLLPQDATGEHLVVTVTATETAYDQQNETQGYAEATVQIDAHADGQAAAAALAARLDDAVRDLEGVQSSVTFYQPERLASSDLADREGDRIVYWISNDYLIRYLEDL